MKKKIRLAFVLMVLVLFGAGCTSKEENNKKNLTKIPPC